LDAAEEMMTLTMESRARVLGLHHPDTLWSSGALARMVERQGACKVCMSQII